MIVTLPNLESAKKALFSLQGKDIKFIKPSQPSMWDAKIIECAFVCKILKTLNMLNRNRFDQKLVLDF